MVRVGSKYLRSMLSRIIMEHLIPGEVTGFEGLPNCVLLNTIGPFEQLDISCATYAMIAIEGSLEADW